MNAVKKCTPFSVTMFASELFGSLAGGEAPCTPTPLYGKFFHDPPSLLDDALYTLTQFAAYPSLIDEVRSAYYYYHLISCPTS